MKSKQKKQRKCGSSCVTECFSIRPLRNDAYHKEEVVLHFDGSQKTHDSLQGEKPYPVFNRDGKVYTPAFTLGIDKLQFHHIYDQNQSIRQIIENDLTLLSEHYRKIMQNLEQQSHIYYPKPSRKNKYCTVCYSNYDDYLDVPLHSNPTINYSFFIVVLKHIKSKYHKKNIKSNKFNDEVLKLCEDLFGNKNKNASQSTTKAFQTEIKQSNTSIDLTTCSHDCVNQTAKCRECTDREAEAPRKRKKLQTYAQQALPAVVIPEMLPNMSQLWSYPTVAPPIFFSPPPSGNWLLQPPPITAPHQILQNVAQSMSLMGCFYPPVFDNLLIQNSQFQYLSNFGGGIFTGLGAGNLMSTGTHSFTNLLPGAMNQGCSRRGVKSNPIVLDE